MSKRTQKGKIQKRILRANLILIIGPMIILSIFAFSQISVLGGYTTSDAREHIEIEGFNALQNKSSDVANYVKTWFDQISIDLSRLTSYNEDLFNKRINITENRLSYHQSGIPILPKLVYSTKYDKYINTSFSDFTNNTVINSHVEQLINKSAYMDYIFNPIYEVNTNYVTMITCYDDGITRIFPYINNSRSIYQDKSAEEWYNNTKNLNGQIYFENVNHSLLGPAILLSQASMYDNNSVFGCSAIEIELSSLRIYLSNIKIHKTGYVVMIDRDGNALSHPDMPNDSIGSPIVDLEVDTVEFYSILNNIINEEQNIETFEKNEESWVISYT
ncbi:MAG: hypothetical protein ACFE9Z_09700, partial [Promethearchaeota archaeon]